MNITPELLNTFRQRGACGPGVDKLATFATFQEAWNAEENVQWMLTALAVFGLPRPDLFLEFARKVRGDRATNDAFAEWRRLHAWSKSAEDSAKWADVLRETYRDFDFSAFTVPPQSGPPPANRAKAPCVSLGEPTGETLACPTCRGNVQVKTFDCARFALATIEKPVKDAGGAKVACCKFCAKYEAKPAS